MSWGEPPPFFGGVDRAGATFVPAGAAERERTIAASAQVSSCQEPGLGFYARSAVDPGGELAAEPSGPNERMVLADLDRIADARNPGTFVPDRRPGRHRS